MISERTSTLNLHSILCERLRTDMVLVGIGCMSRMRFCVRSQPGSLNVERNKRECRIRNLIILRSHRENLCKHGARCHRFVCKGWYTDAPEAYASHMHMACICI